MNDLKQAIKHKGRQLGFILAGVTSSEPPASYPIFESWLNAGMHGTMQYLAEEKGRARRSDAKLLLPECKSILVLGIPYAAPTSGQIASYAVGNDYHDVLPRKMGDLVNFIEEQVGQRVPNRYYTDTGPILEREFGQRAGLGWIGKNTCLINPRAGSTFFLAEILLGIDLEPDEPFTTDHCGTCTRCLDACPTQCILPDRVLDARRCISYLTIELKDDIPEDLRPLMQDWIFGCDICQQVCPWNRFAQPADPAFEPPLPLRVRTSDLLLKPQEFNQVFKNSPIKRPKRRGYLRNIAVATGNTGSRDDLPLLDQALDDADPMVKRHAKWAMDQINGKTKNE